MYKVNIFSNDKHIKDSPFVFMVEPADKDIKPLSAKLLGISSHSTIAAEENVVFNIDVSSCGGKF